MRGHWIPVLVRILQMFLNSTVVVILVSAVAWIHFCINRVLKRLSRHLRIFVKKRFRWAIRSWGKMICWLLRMAACHRRVCWLSWLLERSSVVYEKRRLGRVARRRTRVGWQSLLENGIDVSEWGGRWRVARPLDLSGSNINLFVEKGANYHCSFLIQGFVCKPSTQKNKQCNTQAPVLVCDCTYLRGELVDREVELYCTHTVNLRTSLLENW